MFSFLPPRNPEYLLAENVRQLVGQQEIRAIEIRAVLCALGINLVAMDQLWSLTSSQKDDMLLRVTASISALALSRGQEIPEELAYGAAVSIERKAYTAAQVASNTTTGSRPITETTKAYTRKLAELLLETVINGIKVEGSTETGQATEVVDLTGSRDFLTKEATEEVLKPMLVTGAAVKKIKFSTKSFGRDAARVAAEAIKNCSHSLVDADISDIIAGRPEEEALAALTIVCEALASAKLSKLNLSDNALGEKGVRACAAAITTQAALEGLSLQNVGCSIHACRAVEELLQASQNLKQIHLFNNMSADQGAESIGRVLARAPLMEDFKMASSRVGADGGNALARGLMAGSHLLRLDLSDNPMTADVAACLAACIKQQPHLRHLNLNDTSLTDDGLKVICKALGGAAPALEELELSLNEMTATGACAVALALLGKPKLWRLNLRENELEDRGAVVISKALALVPSLRVIDVCGNQIKRVGAVSLAKAAVSLPSLELLALDENMVSEAGLDEVREVFEDAGKSQALGSLDENMEEDDEELDDEEGGDEELAAALAKAAIKA